MLNSLYELFGRSQTALKPYLFYMTPLELRGIEPQYSGLRIPIV